MKIIPHPKISIASKVVYDENDVSHEYKATITKIINNEFWKFQKGEIWGVIERETPKAILFREVVTQSKNLCKGIWIPKSCISLKESREVKFCAMYLGGSKICIDPYTNESPEEEIKDFSTECPEIKTENLETVGIWIPDYMNDPDFFDGLKKAGIWYEKGRIDSDYYKEVSLYKKDVEKFEEVMKSWGW